MSKSDFGGLKVRKCCEMVIIIFVLHFPQDFLWFALINFRFFSLFPSPSLLLYKKIFNTGHIYHARFELFYQKSRRKRRGWGWRGGGGRRNSLSVWYSF